MKKVTLVKKGTAKKPIKGKLVKKPKGRHPNTYLA